GEDQEALDLLRRAYDLYQKADYRQGMMTSGSSIGALLMEMNEADSAIVMLETALQLEREGDVKDLMGRTLLELGTVYRLVGRTADAERILNEALILAQSLNDQPSEAQAFAKLGRTSLDKGAIQQAIQRCTKGLTLADKNLISTERRDNCECLYLAYKAQGNGLKALQFHETFISIRDSLVNDRAQRQLTQRDLLYTFGKQQLADSLAYASEREQLESERMIESLRADQNRNRALATGIGGILLLGGGIAWFITDRRRRQERFEKESATLETQALRSQMNPHFIFNALNSINAFVQKNDQDSATSYLSKFARVMRLVLENSRHAEVPLNDDLEALRGYLDLERMRMEKKFDFTITVDQTIDPEEVMVPPLVVQPFVENAIWHGMAGKEGKGHITLSVARRGSQMVWTIEDDGAGRHAKKEASPLGQPMKKTSLGTAITRSRLDLVQKQHGGKAGFHYTDLPQGTRVEVEIPFLNA
ncbi:MAG TPA: histidine kinase, partial [Flavobacteriales bacterium]|nr:histidine kinase [Flavobacteriales bacterium]